MSRRFRICMAKGGRESARPSYGRPKWTLITAITVMAVIEGDKCPEFGEKGNGQKGETQQFIAIVATVVLVGLLMMVIIICQCYLKTELLQWEGGRLFEPSAKFFLRKQL